MLIPMADLRIDNLGLDIPSTHVLDEVVQNLGGLSLDSKKTDDHKEGATVGLDDFEVLKLLGKGGFASVYQVRKISSSEIFALKVIRKDKIVRSNNEEVLEAERKISAKMDHPFIVHLRYSFHTKENLCLVLDYLNGGELSFHLGNQGLFLEDLARVYTAEIVSAVSYLHANGIMHGDIKSDNVLLDSEGHAVLTDFGLAIEFDEENPESNKWCGTLEFMAPEIILRKSHDRTADWWSVGILLYEMLAGRVPFQGGRRETMRKIVRGKIRLPCFLTKEAHSLLRGLLTRDASKRLGRGGGEEVKRHIWFSSIDWKKLEAREIRPSFVPKVAGKQRTANFPKCSRNVAELFPATSPRCSGGDENAFQGV